MCEAQTYDRETAYRLIQGVLAEKLKVSASTITFNGTDLVKTTLGGLNMTPWNVLVTSKRIELLLAIPFPKGKDGQTRLMKGTWDQGFDYLVAAAAALNSAAA